MVNVFLCILFSPHYATFYILGSRLQQIGTTSYWHVFFNSFFFLFFLFWFSCFTFLYHASNLQTLAQFKYFRKKIFFTDFHHKPWKLIWTSYCQKLIWFSWKILLKDVVLVYNSGILMYYDELLVTCICMIMFVIVKLYVCA